MVFSAGQSMPKLGARVCLITHPQLLGWPDLLHQSPNRLWSIRNNAEREHSPSGSSTASNDAVSKWMRVHLRIVTAPHNDREQLAAIEQAVLERIDPPLNLKGIPSPASH
jgi:hypothetical protein